MSKPTIIMISHGADDNSIDRLNASIADRLGVHGRLTRVDQLTPAWDVATAVHLGSFNHLDEPTFMQLVRDAAWRQPDRLQVFIDREDDSRFSEYDLFDQLRPREIARRAIGRGLGFGAPDSQVAFFDRLRSSPPSTGAGEKDAPSQAALAWVFEVVAIHPSYFFEAFTRVVHDGQSSALDANGFHVSPVDLAFSGVGVRWGSRRTDVRDYTDKSVRAAIDTLSPGDRVQIDGRVCPGPHGIVELLDVRSIVTLA